MRSVTAVLFREEPVLPLRKVLLQQIAERYVLKIVTEDTESNRVDDERGYQCAKSRER